MHSEYELSSLIELLELHPEVEVGSEGFIYGNYIDFPSAHDVDPDLLPEIFELLGIPLPPDFDITSKKALELVDDLLPSTLYEDELPEAHRFWKPDPLDAEPDPDTELLDLYDSHPVHLEKLVGELRSIWSEFKSTEQSMIQKTLPLACFSLIESFARQRAMREAPRFPDNEKLDSYIQAILHREVKDSAKRKKLINLLEPKKSWEKNIPYWELRNALSHDIGEVDVKNGIFIFADNNGKQQKVKADDLFGQLVEYSQKNLG